MRFHFEFLPQGSTVTARPGHLYLDVGNHLGPGVIDNHAPGAPPECTAALVLRFPEFVRSQPVGNEITLILHQWPDLDAVSAAWLARSLLAGRDETPAWGIWVRYVDAIDRGHTRLDPAAEPTNYAVFMVHQHSLAAAPAADPQSRDLRLANSGLAFVERAVGRLSEEPAVDPSDTRLLQGWPELGNTLRRVSEDRRSYGADLDRAETFRCLLAKAGGGTPETAWGVWISRPHSTLFKSWARGDREAAPPCGFVFCAVELGPRRTIFSVPPDSGLTLSGLAERIEEAESRKRAALGRPRTGPPRPGYSNSDPWYDGRGDFHAGTIVDSPRSGTVLTPAELRAVFHDYQRSLTGGAR